MQVHFYGAAGTVTGSCHMLSFKGGNILLDCGLRQGEDAKDIYGESNFGFDPAKIDAVLLSHAHIDHSGLIPLLMKRGFKGAVVTTEATAQLATIMLPDSGHVQEQEVEWLNRKRLRAGKDPVDPLYTVQDAMEALKQFRGVSYGEITEIIPGVKARFNDAGHLLGSSAIEIWVEEDGKSVKIVFSGDIGRDSRPILQDPVDIREADYLIMESTYGDRNHERESDDSKEQQFANIVRTALARGGNLVIPAFAIGRTQELLYYIKRLLSKNLVPGLEKVPVYIDSPLGIEGTRIYERCAKGYYDDEAMKMAAGGSPFDFPTLRIAQSADESKLINFEKGSKIIISSSGMCEAGRIRHHLKHNLYRADSTILFVGYQAVGTLGRMLLDGAKKVKLFGEEVRINATIERIEGFSGHAGKDELIEWLRAIEKKPQKVFLVHGETSVLDTFAQSIRSLGYDVSIPRLGESYDIAMGRMGQTVPTMTAAVPEKEHGSDIAAQLKRIEALLEKSREHRSPDMDLKIDILEADIRALADKWEKLL